MASRTASPFAFYRVTLAKKCILRKRERIPDISFELQKLDSIYQNARYDQNLALQYLDVSNVTLSIVTAALANRKLLRLPNKINFNMVNKFHFHSTVTNMCQNLARRGRCERCDRGSCQRILLKYFIDRRRWDGGLKIFVRGFTAGWR